MSQHLSASRLLTFIATAAVCLPTLSHAQTDLQGIWLPYSETPQDPDLGMYMGVPLNAQGRAAALTYVGDKDEELQRQCSPWLIDYIVSQGFNLAISPMLDPVKGNPIAWVVANNGLDRLQMTIWIDGRPEPGPLAVHTYSGYTTGHWEGNTLVAKTTHIKDGFLDRNGMRTSNQQTISFFLERDDDQLTITALIRDPVYLDGPFPEAKTWKLDSTGRGASNPTGNGTMFCVPAETIAGLSDGYHWISQRPWSSSSLTNMTKLFAIPQDAALGGVETMYPEYRKHLDTEYKVPAGYCKYYCCDASGPNAVCKSLDFN
jgi:hypothetical protein